MVVSSEASVINARYDMLVIVPLTSTRLNGRLYPIIKKGDGALKNDSVALVDQLRSIDKSRVSKVGNPLSTSAMGDIDVAIKHLSSSSSLGHGTLLLIGSGAQLATTI